MPHFIFQSLEYRYLSLKGNKSASQRQLRTMESRPWNHGSMEMRIYGPATESDSEQSASGCDNFRVAPCQRTSNGLFSSSDICTVCAVNFRDFASDGDRPLPGPGERDASDTMTRPCVMSNLSLSAPAMTLLRESFNKEATVLQTRPGMSHDVAMSKEYLMTRLLRALRR